jgi:hypothetical protein
MSNNIINTTPIVTRDARFIGARKLVERGQVEKGALEMLRVLISRAEEEFGESSLNTAAVYYEYGNALFLHISKDSDMMVKDDIMDSVEDSLECMAKSCSILYSHLEELENNKQRLPLQDIQSADYYKWIHEQIPRNLIGIGRILSYQGNHGDSVESLMNAIPFLEKSFEHFVEKSDPAYLRAHRLLIEAYVQVAEELLMCSKGEDVVLSDNDKYVIIESSERIPQARFYYEKSREGLQELVFSMAKMEQEKTLPTSEKADICYLATILMHVGMSLTHAEDTEGDVHNDGNVSHTNPTKKRKL